MLDSTIELIRAGLKTELAQRNGAGRGFENLV
jgi:hypothetical protein